jgi:hypothetical protein
LNLEYLSAAAEPPVELAEPGVSESKFQIPSRYNLYEICEVVSGGWK